MLSLRFKSKTIRDIHLYRLFTVYRYIVYISYQSLICLVSLVFNVLVFFESLFWQIKLIVDGRKNDLRQISYFWNTHAKPAQDLRNCSNSVLFFIKNIYCNA